jgi:ribonuclease VapC
MIVDSSAVIAILRDEAEREGFNRALEDAPTRRISVVNYLEAAIVTDATRNPILSRKVDDLFREAKIVIEPVTALQGRIAREAYRDSGKGSGHPAGLNLGDCFAYALAKVAAEPLLYKGEDFGHTHLPKFESGGI